MYRHAKGIDEPGELPRGVSIVAMIDAILAYEEATGQLDKVPPRSSGKA